MKIRVRLAFRQEGAFWNAYMANLGTLKDAKLIGSILLGAAKKDPRVEKGFKDLMKLTLGNAILEVTGELTDDWTEQPAPESERSGNT